MTLKSDTNTDLWLENDMVIWQILTRALESLKIGL